MIWQAGVDEAGRGPLVGSVFAAAVVLPNEYDLPGLTDSKKLSERRRDELAVLIKQQALAMRRAVHGLERLPEKAWIDGNRVPPNLGCEAEAVVKGDSKIIQISAASVLAKTARDAEMYALAERYPQYGFERHKGYGTAEHLAALQRHGALPEHRRSFAPVREILAQGRLFE